MARCSDCGEEERVTSEGPHHRIIRCGCPSPPRSLEEAVQRIARALADDDGSGWWGEEECGPGHVDAARRLAEAGGVSVLLERLQEVERERDEAIQLWDKNRSMAHRFSDQRAIAEARVASLEEALRRWLAAYTDCAAGGVTFHAAGKAQTTRLVEADEKARQALAQGAAAPLPGDRHE